MKRPALGADLVIPLLALAFAVYFFFSIADLGWEAKANGVLVGAILVVLIALQLVRMALQVARGAASLRVDVDRTRLIQRAGLVATAALFIATLELLGLTLGLAAAMFAALKILGVRSRAALVALPLVVAAAAYLLFIALLQSEFPHGPIEKLLS